MNRGVKMDNLRILVLVLSMFFCSNILLAQSLYEGVPADELFITDSKAHNLLSNALQKAISSVPDDALIVGHDCQSLTTGYECVVLYRKK